MKITVFGKKKTSKEGREFTSYFSKLTNKDGEEIGVTVKFRKECGYPSTVPVILEFDKKTANITTEVTDDGSVFQTLWITEFKESDYVDHSLDDFE